ncbi:MAG TPA: sugar nucleotide-binding protein, partial [Stellaceae bacterium]|nr:sugar nucleotide-binding protein [Stellaceae bacterium]
EIVGLARTLGALPSGSGPRIEPITTDQYPTAAQRPMNSVLDCRKIAALGISPPLWRSSLPAVVRELVRAESR